ncbi:hypothetical protein LEMLEM_LOCUS13581 [Lemmus lemmus]
MGMDSASEAVSKPPEFWSSPPETRHLQCHAYSIREVNTAL